MRDKVLSNVMSKCGQLLQKKEALMLGPSVGNIRAYSKRCCPSSEELKKEKEEKKKSESLELLLRHVFVNSTQWGDKCRNKSFVTLFTCNLK